MSLSEEERLQRTVAQYLDLMAKSWGFRWFHPPNGGNRDAITGHHLKQMGVKRGVPDIIIQFSGGRCVEIELKGAKGKQSASQLAWQRKSRDLGIHYYLCRSIDDVVGVLSKESEAA